MVAMTHCEDPTCVIGECWTRRIAMGAFASVELAENRPAWREESLHVLADRCRTCVFRPGNLMRLAPGRLASMVAFNRKHDRWITCHTTLYRDDVDQAVCRGYFDGFVDESLPLSTAVELDLVELDPVPEDDVPILVDMVWTEARRAWREDRP